MTALQLEALTLRIVDQVRSGQPVEDSRVELKREWPAEPYKAARRIGGHANASQGQPAVWIIGLDEKEGVTGADAAELSDWWPQVQRYFDDLSPELALSLNVPVEDVDGTQQTVVALSFDTSRLPFVVKAKGQDGPIQREVPYRGATGVRSATRGDIIRLALPPFPHTEVQLLEAGVQLSLQKLNAGWSTGTGKPKWAAEWTLYLTMTGTGEVIFPAHLFSARIEGDEMDPVALRPVFREDDTNRNVVVSGHDLIVRGSGRATAHASTESTVHIGKPYQQLRLTLEIRALNTDRAHTISSDLLEPTEDGYKLTSELNDRRLWYPLG